MNRIWTLRIPVPDAPMVIIEAYLPDQPPTTYRGHTRLDLRIRQGGRDIFPLDRHLYIGIPFHHDVDSTMARATAIAAAAALPEEPDGYTEAQLAWVRANQDHLSMVREDRFPPLWFWIR